MLLLLSWASSFLKLLHVLRVSVVLLYFPGAGRLLFQDVMVQVPLARLTLEDESLEFVSRMP